MAAGLELEDTEGWKRLREAALIQLSSKFSRIQFVFTANFWFITSCVQRDSTVILQKLTSELQWLVFRLYSEYHIIVTLNVAFPILTICWYNSGFRCIFGQTSVSDHFVTHSFLFTVSFAFPPQQFARLGTRRVPKRKANIPGRKQKHTYL